MGRKLEWELSGKSDVPQKMAQAKASMEGLDGAANALSKKFREGFKDIALGFLAPMVLIQKAISFISDKMAEAKQNAEEAKQFAKDEESKKYMKPGARDVVIRAIEREEEAKRQAKAQLAQQLAYEEFLKNDPRGAELVRKMSIPSARVYDYFVPKSPFGRKQNDRSPSDFLISETAKEPAVRAAIEALIAADILKEMKPAAPSEGLGESATAQKIAEVSGNVIGVGQSPQLDAMRQQIVLQEDMANSLRQLVEADQAKQGFRPERNFDLGGMGSSGRTVFPR